jgi:hypothetical protein
VRGTLRVGREWAAVPIEGRWIALLHGRGLDPELGSDEWFGRRLESGIAETSDPSLFSFDFGRQPAGRFALLLPRFGIATRCDVQTDLTVEVAVPPPVEVELTLLSPEGTRNVTDCDVEWGPAVDLRDFRDVAHHVEPDLERGGYRFVAPEGPLVVRVQRPGEPFPSIQQAFRVAPDSRTLSIRLDAPPIELDVVLLDGEQPLPKPWTANLKVERDGVSAIGRYRFPAHGTHVTFRLPGPGRYRVSAGALEGFDPPAPVEVEVREGERNVLHVPMVRRP